MSHERVELRASGMHDVGVRLDDLLEAARKEVLRCDGAVSGLQQCAKAVGELMAHVDRDVDEGKYDLEMAKQVKLYLSRAIQVVQNLGMNASNQRMISAGQVQMAETVVAITKKMYDAEMQKLAAVTAAETAPPSTDLRERISGMHPPATIKEQRRAEEAQAAASAPPQAAPVPQKAVAATVRKKPGPKPKNPPRVQNP